MIHFCWSNPYMKVFVALRQVFCSTAEKFSDIPTVRQDPRWYRYLWIISSPLATKIAMSVGAIKEDSKKGPWLLIVDLSGWNTTQLCDDYFMNHGIRIPMKQAVWWKVRRFFFRGSVGLKCLRHTLPTSNSLPLKNRQGFPTQQEAASSSN